MKLKLIFPPAFDEAKLSMLPHGMCVLTGYLRQQGFDVDQDDVMIKLRRINIPSNIFKRPFDMNLMRHSHRLVNYLFNDKKDKQLENFSKKMTALTNFDGYKVIGICVHSVFQFPFALLMAKYIKENYNALVIFGGPFITLRGHEFIAKTSFVDLMIQGDGEIPMKHLLEELKYKDMDNIDMTDIPGLIYRKDDKIFINKAISFSAEDMALPDFEGLDLDLYKYDIKGSPEIIFTYQFTKGCKGRCAFCTHYVISDVLETKSPLKIVSELKELCNKYNARFFYICDSAINSNYDKLRKICEAIKEERLNILWGSLARPDNITEELAKGLKESGCKFLRFGFESGSDRILKAMGKGHTVESALACVKNMHKYRIKSLGTLITGFPGETEKDIIMTKDFIRKISSQVSELSCGVCFVEPKSDIQKNPEKFGIKNLEARNKEFVNCDNMPRRVYAFDEVNGLNWQEKKCQQIKSQTEIIKNIKKFIVNRHGTDLLTKMLPFFFYDFFGKNKYNYKILSYLYALVKKDYYYTYSDYYNV